MKPRSDQTVVITGATGLQGGAVTRCLLEAGWNVRALTRNPAGTAAQALQRQGAQVVQADMEDVPSLQRVFEGVYGVYSVQNPFISGPEAEVRQGRNVADAARKAGARHLVYASAGTGQSGPSVPSWDTKLQVEEHMKAAGLPLTILRPLAFMELMTHKKFFPAVAAWHLMPALVGSSRPIGWICTDDVGAIAARIFGEPDKFIGKEFALVSDVQSLDQCRAIYREVMGQNPPRFPLPHWLFKRFGFAGQDLTAMWNWLRTGWVDLDMTGTRALHPSAVTVREWLRSQQSDRSHRHQAD